MKRTVKTSLITGLAPLPLALAVCTATARVNLIQDGGFESGSLAWTSPRSALSLDPAAAHSGSSGLRIGSTFNWCPYGALYQMDPAALANGTLYEVGARVRLAAGESGDAWLWLGLIRNGAEPIWLDGDQSSYDGRAYPDRWTTLYGVHEANFAPGDDLKLCISGGKGKAVYVDDAYAAPLTPEQVGYQPPATLDADALVRASGNRLVLGPDDAPFVLKGVNVYQYDPGDDAAPATDHFSFKNVNAASYEEIRALGFNSVRLMLAYKLFEDDSAPGVYKDEGWAVVDRHVQWAKANGLRLILDMHVPPGGYQSASGFKNFGNRPDLQQRLEDLWAAIAARYRNETAIIGYDLINEPYVNGWFAYAETVIARIRAVDPNHLVVVEVSFHPNDPGMYRLADDAVLYDVHWYEPWSWAGSHTTNSPYTGNLETFKQQLREGEGLSELYDPATDSFTVPFNIGEYGVVFEKYELAGVNGQQWLEDANAAFDHFGISRQLFAYNESNFGIYRGWNSYPREHTVTTEPLLAALPGVNGTEPPPPPPPPPPVTETDLAAALAWSPAAPNAGDAVTFTLGVNNLGAGATAARGELVLLPGMELVSAAAGCTGAADTVTCTAGTLAPGARQDWAVGIRFAQAGTWVTTASVHSDGLPDPNPANDQATAVVTVAEPPPSGDIADLALTRFKAASTSPRVGRAAELQLVVKNLGDDPAANTRFVLPLPAGMSWISGPPECAANGSEVVCSFGELAKNVSRTRFLYLRPTVTGPLTLVGSAVSDTFDANGANNQITVNLTVRP